jgi:hypothetical protein
MGVCFCKKGDVKEPQKANIIERSEVSGCIRLDSKFK